MKKAVQKIQSTLDWRKAKLDNKSTWLLWWAILSNKANLLVRLLDSASLTLNSSDNEIRNINNSNNVENDEIFVALTNLSKDWSFFSEKIKAQLSNIEDLKQKLQNRSMTEIEYSELCKKIFGELWDSKKIINYMITHPECNYSFEWDHIVLIKDDEFYDWNLESLMDHPSISHFSFEEAERFMNKHMVSFVEGGSALRWPFSLDQAWGSWDAIIYQENWNLRSLWVSARGYVRHDEKSESSWAYGWWKVFVRFKHTPHYQDELHTPSDTISYLEKELWQFWRMCRAEETILWENDVSSSFRFHHNGKFYDLDCTFDIWEHWFCKFSVDDLHVVGDLKLLNRHTSQHEWLDTFLQTFPEYLAHKNKLNGTQEVDAMYLVWLLQNLFIQKS